MQKLISKIRKIYNKKLMKKVAVIGSIHKDGWKILENNNFEVFEINNFSKKT